jgi:hypothetical protein
MPTIEEILNSTLETPQEKTAEATPVETDEIEKLAMEIGLVDSNIEASPQPSHTKEAQMSMSLMYNDLFPEDAELDKTASAGGEEDLEKVAAAEEALGARAFDYFSARFDARLEKIAAESISDCAEPPQALANNKAGGKGSIDTTPSIDNELPADHGADVVGKEEQKSIKHAAVRKAMLLAQLEE